MTMEILLVEDNPHDLELTLRALNKANFAGRIEVARDGEEALECVRREGRWADRESEPPPRLIMLDLKLPKIDGLEVLESLKGDPRTSAIPIVVLTSSQEQSDLQGCYQLGVNSYVVKPVAVEGFRAAVTQLGLYWLQLNRVPEPEATR
jgi:two-component system response regulator